MDPILTDNPEIVDKIRIESPVGGSDHCVILFCVLQNYKKTLSNICCDLCPKKLRKSFPKSKFLRERKILMRKRTKLRKKNQTIRVKNSLLNIEELLLKSHEKEHNYV